MVNKWHLFVSRIAFICNIFFIGCLLLRYTHVAFPETVTGLILIMGWIPVSPLLNLICFAATGFRWIKLKKTPAPAWLPIINALFLFTQLIYFLAIYQ
ncbi:hypothetical protein [Filimonas effusa]|uniref:Uncharacterized protein n=1 Tax=Filimonas effusa TaxID=2508721 RepID=A0A4Q1DBH2_9BACT|nr:hypothetical protein [Filimonas effusa]RXK85933.1 hypothetical protein ESB13_03735 [Filimonas effusa]